MYPELKFVHHNMPANYEMESINTEERENPENTNPVEEEHISANSIANGESSNRKRSNPSFFGRIAFQKLLLFSAIRLIIYLNKLYQDVNAVSEYSSAHDIYYCIISIASLIIPPIIYALYLIGDDLAKDDEIDKTKISTQTVNGFLLIPWQIKRHLDVLEFAAQRVCFWRSPNHHEENTINEIKRKAEILEYFEDFYAGFLQLLLQLYILILLIESKDLGTKFLIGQFIGSSLSVLSMMAAVRRRDDGPLTIALSFIGWLSIFISRVTVFALIATFITKYLFLLCLIHSIAMSIWIYGIAIESYLLYSSTAREWTKRKLISLAILVFLFFGIPSLLFWPIMFQLKENRRPLTFLLIITVENILLLGLWFALQITNKLTLKFVLTDTHVILVIVVVCSTLSGVLFLTGYILCKPKLTDQVVLHEMRTTNADSYGIYYDFCDIVFKLPNTQRIAEDRERIRDVIGPK